jgi:hypothetical protein
MAAGRIERESLGWSSRSPCVHVEHAISWQGQGPGLHLHEGKKKKNAWWPIHQYMMPTVLPMHTISSISHITPFFRSFFEDVQTEEVFVFFFIWNWLIQMATVTWKQRTRAERSMPCHPYMLLGRNATQPCVCVYVWLIDSPLSHTHHIDRDSNLHRSSSSFSIDRARFHSSRYIIDRYFWL